MEIYKHYKGGTVHITDGEYKGYYPDRNEPILSIHIIDGEYHIHIYSDAITIQYKYIRMVYEHSFTIGRWQYTISVLNEYKGSERKRLIEMDNMLRELVNEHTIHSVSVRDYGVISLLNSHRVST